MILVYKATLYDSCVESRIHQKYYLAFGRRFSFEILFMSNIFNQNCQNHVLSECRFCHRKHCVRYKEQCYYLKFGVNWYEARHQCKRLSLYLVDMQYTNLTKFITDEGYSKQGKFWTAYHREDWVVMNPYKQGSSLRVCNLTIFHK